MISSDDVLNKYCQPRDCVCLMPSALVYACLQARATVRASARMHFRVHFLSLCFISKMVLIAMTWINMDWLRAALAWVEKGTSIMSNARTTQDASHEKTKINRKHFCSRSSRTLMTICGKSHFQRRQNNHARTQIRHGTRRKRHTQTQNHRRRPAHKSVRRMWTLHIPAWAECRKFCREICISCWYVLSDPLRSTRRRDWWTRSCAIKLATNWIKSLINWNINKCTIIAIAARNRTVALPVAIGIHFSGERRGRAKHQWRTRKCHLHSVFLCTFTAVMRLHLLCL